ncbi:MAG TPA: phosphate regulon sensor histidine kinase PhoR [Steroidobacteraceae bacterium]|nr:phosphate regulon sensor histidine kinase PhoR [Steroidobacteraceae bacterium]
MTSGFQVGLFIVLRLLAVAALGLLLGWPLGSPWAGLSLTCGAYLCWQLITLFRVEWWVRHRGFAEPPDIGGPWGEVITQIVRLHRRKRFHKQRFVQLFRQIQRSTAALPDGVVILNDLREIVWFNRMAGQLLFLRRPADLGLRIDNLVRQPEFVRYLNTGQFSNPVVVRGGKGDHLYLSLQVVPYGEGQQLLLVRDVSHQMRLEAMRKDFVANASHELRSPLTVISGYLETLSQDPILDLELQGPIGEMRRQAERMTTIITELLELSRLEAAQDEIDSTPVDVVALMAMLRKDVLARPEHPAEVRVRADSDAMLTGNESEIHSALSNLVDNAAKYTLSSGSIEIRWSVDEAGGHFAVTDTGIGIHPEHIPRLTERFYRVDAGRARNTGGAGLGLAIVKHVLQRHAATLEITSIQGRGSTFTCHFPPERLRAATVVREHSATA